MEKNTKIIKSRSMTRMSMGHKGVGIIAVAVVLMVSVIIIEGVIVNTFIVDMEVMKRSAREIAVIHAVDAVEFAKKALQQAVSYSFYGASDDVLRAGGFCAFDESPCDEDCKVPINVPTRDCTPWWRVYETTYAPEYGMPSDPEDEPESETFAYYLFSRMSYVFNSYGSSFLSPIYCPQSGGKVIIEDIGTYRIRADITNIEDGTIEYKTDNLEIAEHNTYFSDTFDASTLELFEFARSKFVDRDPVKSAFTDVDSSMPNIWCETTDDDLYCDMTASCGKDCFGGNCCCKDMYFGDACGSNIGEEFCNDQLSTYCSGGPDDCDFNNDGAVSADEKYKCDVQNEIYGPVTSGDGTIEASATADRCFNVKHTAEFDSSSAITVNWKSEVSEDCEAINDKPCGCDDPCTGDEEECKDDDYDCTSITTGTNFNGRCPWTKTTCPNGCCAIEFICTEWKDTSVCRGTNTETCDPDNCDTTCCDYTPACDCDECGDEEECSNEACSVGNCDSGCCDYTPAPSCDEDCSCCGVSCPIFGPCGNPCCDWLSEGGGDAKCRKTGTCPACCSAQPSCDSKSFDCDSCCNGDDSTPESCDTTSCKDFSKTNCGCSGCFWDEGDWHHKIERSCRANVCGMSCCEETDTLYEDMTCEYDYFGSADTTVTVKDIVNEYPIGDSWSSLETSFNVVSGNAEDCSGDVETEICCQAAATNDVDMVNGCKSETPIEISSIADCDCSECAVKNECESVSCSGFPPCGSECCEIYWEEGMPHDVCVKKDFVCEDCCDDEYTTSSTTTTTSSTTTTTSSTIPVITLCENFLDQECKISCDYGDVGIGLGTCPEGQVCCLGPIPYY